MKFRTAYDFKDSNCESSNVGETKRPVYTLVNDHGERSLKLVDYIDIPEMINSYSAECDVKSILRRYSLTGDSSLLRRGVVGVYEDVRGFETNFAKLIDSARESALLKLQIAKDGEEMSQVPSGAEPSGAEPSGAEPSGAEPNSAN